ncbi:YdiK family protein [Paenalkalicoccus suaedae]|uniref:YdiK family protein n=1 Tax=Paenalkalicoccus suaedae TaxID=2592382 RepID=A0A859FB75_9BACI|nr:DUF4305 domain-containing protein [Paenalkalicoccus suaedae]QKS70277.1 YdiK family protein [Paenalkalicoccus suaedae]
MQQGSRASGFLFLALGTMFVFFAIRRLETSGEWDALLILLVAFAAFDYMMAFKHFGAVARQKQK